MMSIMRYPDGHKAETRARIVRAAAEALRRAGLSGVSIPALMKEAGLTHGGFYGYFPDRDALVAEAIKQAAADTGQGAFAEDLPLDDTLRLYLSEGHVAHPEQGCVVAALGSEGGHQSGTVRKAFAEVARSLLGRVERKVHPARAARTLSDEGLRLAATMVGAVILARLVDDEALARRILRAARAPQSQDG
jgi:TetR/AcrR family transcriptional regulator, transcriptional repressor for nem operon